MGLWLVQQCKRSFDARGRKLRIRRAGQPRRQSAGPAFPCQSRTTRAFLNPPDMPKAIQEFCRETGQPVPKTEGELIRCAYESLALRTGRCWAGWRN